MKGNDKEKFYCVFLSLVLMCTLVVLSASEGFFAAATVQNECLRLHVLANSDDEADQNVKLLVRDALLAETEDMFLSSADSDEAAAKVMENKQRLEEIAVAVLRENGFSYGAGICVETEYFSTRQYEGITLPAGNYEAVKVVLGEGQGHNWWCVMFPSLCIPSVTKKADDSVYGVFGENGGDLVTGKSGYKIKFRLVEIAEEIIEAIKS